LLTAVFLPVFTADISPGRRRGLGAHRTRRRPAHHHRVFIPAAVLRLGLVLHQAFIGAEHHLDAVSGRIEPADAHAAETGDRAEIHGELRTLRRGQITQVDVADGDAHRSVWLARHAGLDRPLELDFAL